MRALVSGVIGALLAGLVVVGGVTVYQNASTTGVQRTNPGSVGYADE